MEDQVSGKAAIDLAFMAYESGQKSVTREPQRLRVQAALGVAVDVIVHGEMTSAVLRNTARLLVANADVLGDPAESQPIGSERSDEGNRATDDLKILQHDDGEGKP